MFIQILSDMDEVQLRQLQLKKLGDDVSEEVVDILGHQTATVALVSDSFVTDFRQNSDETQRYLEQQAARAAGGR